MSFIKSLLLGACLTLCLAPPAPADPSASPTLSPLLEPNPEPTASPIPRPSQAPTSSPLPQPTATPSPWFKPIEGVLMNPFGNSYPFYGSLRSGHTGVDLAAPVGTPVSAVAPGVVVKVYTKTNQRYGNYVVIRHQQAPYHTLYAHLQRISVKPGSSVQAGTRIGASGVSGLASYPHLHFEVLDRLPVYDGAWGYRYICNQSTAWIQMLDRRRLGAVAGLPWLSEHIGFVGAEKLELHSFIRMSGGQCREQTIAPLTYFNPQRLLPAYPTGLMPDLSGRQH